MLKANVPESSAIAELLAVAISASEDALALAASVVHRMPTALAAFLPLITSASADALALAAGVVLAAAMPTAFLALVISGSANPLPRRWA